MDLLAFSRGPALAVATAIFVLGVVWRLFGILLLRFRRDLSTPRNKMPLRGLILTATRSWPKKEFVGATGFIEVI